MLRGWSLSIADRFNRAFGENEPVKCALAANLAYWHDDPETLWWVLFAVAQGGYIGSGGRYVRGGSQRLSHALFQSLQSRRGRDPPPAKGYSNPRLIRTGAHWALSMSAAKVATQSKFGHLSSSVTPLRQLSLKCCPDRHATGSSPHTPTGAFQSPFSQRPLVYRCAQPDRLHELFHLVATPLDETPLGLSAVR